MNPNIVPPQYETKATEKVKFPTAPQYKDLWAAYAFGLGTLAFIILSIFCFVKYKLSVGAVELPYLSQGAVSGLFAIVLIVGCIASFGYFFLLSRYAGHMIVATLIISVLLQLGIGALILLFGNYALGPILILCGCISGFIFIKWRGRIPFAKVVVKHVTKIVNHYPGLWTVAFTGLVFQLGITTWVIFAILYWCIYVNSLAVELPGSGWAIFFMLFMHHWISAVITSGVHMSIAGVTATAYFKGRYEGKDLVAPTENILQGSIKRAFTTSFGVNCLGSLIIALVEILNQVLSSIGVGGNSFSFACCSCITNILNSLKDMFSRYALSYAAIYGMDFQTSATTLFDMISKRGVRVLINELMVERVLYVGSVAVGLISMGIAALYLNIAQKEAYRTYSVADAESISWAYFLYYLAFCLASLYIGILLFSVVATMISSGAATTVVCLAQDPQVLQGCNPILYEKVHKAYPSIFTQV